MREEAEQPHAVIDRDNDHAFPREILTVAHRVGA